jgi:hypothetical protein
MVGADANVIVGQVTASLGEESLVATYAAEVIKNPKFEQCRTMSPEQLSNSVAKMIEDLLKRTPHVDEEDNTPRQKTYPSGGNADRNQARQLPSPESLLPEIDALRSHLLKSAPDQEDAIHQAFYTLLQTVNGFGKVIPAHGLKGIRANMKKIQDAFSDQKKPKKPRKKNYYNSSDDE